MVKKLSFIFALTATTILTKNALCATCAEDEQVGYYLQDLYGVDDTEFLSTRCMSEKREITIPTIDLSDNNLHKEQQVSVYDIVIQDENGNIVEKNTYIDAWGDGLELYTHQKLENNKVIEESFPAEGARYYNDYCGCSGNLFESTVYRKYDENGKVSEEKVYGTQNSYDSPYLTSETKYENGDKIETIYNYGEADYYCDNYIDEGWSECWDGAEGVLLSTQTYKNGQLIGDVSYGISEYCPEEGDCFDIWAIKSTNNYAQDTNIKEYNPADGSYTIKDENGNIIGFEGKRIYTIDEANAVAGKTNHVKIRYR